MSAREGGGAAGEEEAGPEFMRPLLSALKWGDRTGETYPVFGLTDWGALVCALTYLVLLSPHLQTPEIYIQITLFVMMACLWPTAALRILVMVVGRKKGQRDKPGA